MAFKLIMNQLLYHVDNDANAFIFNTREYFWYFNSLTTPTRQVSGFYVESTGIEIVIIQVQTMIISLTLSSCYLSVTIRIILYILLHLRNTLTSTALELKS